MTLEVHNVGLHEHGAAVAEHRHGLGRERKIGVLIDAESEAFGRGLQEISVACRALRIQLEVFDASVVQDDDFDVLPAHVHNHVWIFVEFEGRLGVGNCLHQRHVSVENIFQDVLRIASGCDAQYFQFCVLILDLGAQILEHLDRVLDRIAV